MLHEIIKLNKIYPIENDPWIEIFVPYNNDLTIRDKSKAIVVVPGGGYGFVSLREGDPVCISYMKENFVTIKLNYTINKKYPTPMLELACVIDYIRNNADKYYIDKDKIGIIGFSAGGHLVTSYGYLYKNSDFIKYIPYLKNNLKPNCIIASYPVITMKEHTHFGTKNIITNNEDDLIKLLSVEDNIDSSYPPTFVWTTLEDTCVPYVNSLLYIDALKENNVYCESFIYPHLDHGLSVITPMIYDLEILKNEHMQEVSKWFNKSVDFINKVL